MEKNGRHLTREKVKYANASFCVFVYRKMTRTGLPHSVKSCHSLTFIHKQKKKSFRALGVLEAPYVCRNPIRDDFVLILENSFSEPSELGLEVGSQESLIRKYYYVLHTKKKHLMKTSLSMTLFYYRILHYCITIIHYFVCSATMPMNPPKIERERNLCCSCNSRSSSPLPK